MRPRCCFRNFTFLGINMTKTLHDDQRKAREARKERLALRALRPLRSKLLRPRLRSPRRSLPVLFLSPTLRHQAFSFIEPHLDADLTVGRVRLREAVIDVRAQRLQR